MPKIPLGPALLLVSSLSPAAVLLDFPGARVEWGGCIELKFRPVDPQGQTILLEISARIDSPTMAGSTELMRLRLNGHWIEPTKGRTIKRLENKPLVSPVAPNLRAPWYGAGGWRVVYAADFASAKKEGFYRDDPYRLVLDVTDLVRADSENTLSVEHAGDAAIAPKVGKSAIVLGEIVVRTVETPSATREGETPSPFPVNSGEPGAGPASYTHRATPGGGFVIVVGGREISIESEFSYPNVGLNRLVAEDKPDPRAQPDWKPVVTETPGRMEVLAKGPSYALKRTVDFSPRRLLVRDTLSNPRHELTGLLVRNQVLLSNLPVVVYLAGNPDPNVNEYYSPGNPSVFVAFGHLGLGILAEDDVLRNQARLFFNPEVSAAGLRTGMLCIPSGQSVTLEWSIYPVDSTDYYDFINLVREDWGSNYTVDGAWTFFDPEAVLATPADELAKELRRLGIRYVCSAGGWVDRRKDKRRIGFGSEVLSEYWADYRERLKSATSKLHGLDPELKVLVYYDTERDTSADAPRLYRGSLLSDAKGAVASTEWNGRYNQTWSMVATLENGFGRRMLEVADAYLNDIGADGLYWDEMENTGFGEPLITYDQWDGHSCTLDPSTYVVAGKVGVTTLLGQSHRLAVIDRVRSRGGEILGNGPATTRAILSKKVQRMIEIQHNDTWGYEGQLATPLGYLGSRTDFGNVVRALDLASLPVGTTWSYSFDFSRYLFPLTPIELHGGYLLGRERIIVTHAGNYGWPGDRSLVEVLQFGTAGESEVSSATTRVTASEARTAVTLGPGEAAVLIRQPVEVEPIAGVAEVTHVSYRAEGLKMKIKAPEGAKIRVRPGPWVSRPGGVFRLTVGEQPSRPVQADQDGVVRFDVSASDPTEVILSPSAT